MASKKILEHFRIDIVAVAGLIAIFYVSLLLMGILQADELPDFRIEDLQHRQEIWIAVGAAGFLASFLAAQWAPRASVVAYCVAWMFLLGLCVGLGDRVHGLPYLHLRSVWINMMEAWCAAALAATAALLTADIRLEYQIILGGLPFIVAWLVGSLNGATCYGIAFALMISKKSFWPAVGILFLGCIPAAISMAAEFPPIHSPNAMKWNQFLLYDLRAGANAHTELALSHVMHSMGTFPFLLAWAGLLIIVLRLFGRGNYLAVGFAAFLTAQSALAALVSFGLLRNPASGVAFPFLSYSGSLLITEMIVLGAALGWRAKKI